MPNIEELRQEYHEEVCARLIHLKKNGEPSMSDVGSKLSIAISQNLIQRLPYNLRPDSISGQQAGKLLENVTRDFLQNAFGLLSHLRPGKWSFSLHDNIAAFDQYTHLSTLAELIQKNQPLKAVLGDYFIAPDIVVGREPVSDREINRHRILSTKARMPLHTPLRAANVSAATLHASISCKWTLRSDRSQNARTEALLLIRNRKGHIPHIVVVTGEPMPTRIASIALGTGDIDCVYHFALYELINAVADTGDEAAIESLNMMIEGRRLRDISDLPFDLAL
jgi:hypothetical protein